MKVGDLVRAVSVFDDKAFHPDKWYVVSAVEWHHGFEYIKVLGEDNRGHTILAELWTRGNYD